MELSDAVDTIMKDLHEARKKFDQAETRLIERARDGFRPDQGSAIELVLKTIKYNCTGNLAWR